MWKLNLILINFLSALNDISIELRRPPKRLASRSQYGQLCCETGSTGTTSPWRDPWSVLEHLATLGWWINKNQICDAHKSSWINWCHQGVMNLNCFRHLWWHSRVLFHLSDETFHHSIIDFMPANLPAAWERPPTAQNRRESFQFRSGNFNFWRTFSVLFVFSHFSSLSN